MRLGAIGYFADFFISMALILAIVCRTLVEPWHVCAEWTFFVLAGATFWTFLEYIIHRFVYHHIPVFRHVHDAHHAEPGAYIGAPAIIGILFILSISYLPFVSFSPTIARGVTAGMLLGYCAYQLIHHASHHWPRMPFGWVQRALRHHAQHHYLSEDVNFGITTSLWDWFFGTNVKAAQRRIA